MTGSADLWLIFAALGLATVLPRGSFIVLGHRAELPAVLQRALRYAPAAALAAIITPDIVLAGGEVAPLNPRLAAALAVIAVCSRWRNPWLPFVAGMATLLGLGQILGR